MKRKKRLLNTKVILIAASLLAACVFQAQAAEILYGSLAGAQAGGTSAGAIVTIDQTTGQATVLGIPVPGQSIPGLAFDSTGRLFGITHAEDGSIDTTLIEIDPETGELLNTVGNVGDRLIVYDLSFQPDTDVLYATSGSGLITIDTETAAITVLGDLPAASYPSIAFAPDGTLYFKSARSSNEDKLLTIDPADGSELTNNTIDPPTYALGLGVRPSDGMIFAADCCGEGTGFGDVYTIDPDTFETTLLGSNGDNFRLHDLAFRITATGATVASGNATISGVTYPDDPIDLPAGFSLQETVGFTATGFPGTTADISITFASLPANPIIYKVVNSNWILIYPTNTSAGITNVTLNGDTLSYTIEDNSDCDLDDTVGTIQDPVAAGSSGTAGGDSSGCFINTVAEDLFELRFQ